MNGREMMSKLLVRVSLLEQQKEELRAQVEQVQSDLDAVSAKVDAAAAPVVIAEVAP